MSYDIELCDPVTDDVLRLDEPHQMRGGTFVLGGNSYASLNVTYNYGRIFTRETVLGVRGIRRIYGLTATESIPILKAAIAVLGDDKHEDYWKPTEGNAKAALCQLLALATLRPDGVWRGD